MPSPLLRLSLGDARVELRTEPAALRDTLAHIYRAFAAESESPSVPNVDALLEVRTWRAYIDGKELNFTRFYRAVRTLEDLIAWRLLASVPDALVLHAAAVEGEGRTILLAGPSGSGKTTVALELVRRGLRFVADEYVVIKDGLLHPFPRSACRKLASTGPPGVTVEIPSPWGHRSYLFPDLRVGLDPIPLRQVSLIFPTRAEVDSPSAHPLGRGESCAKLLPSAFGVVGREAETWLALAELTAGGRSCSLHYAEAPEGVDAAFRVLEAAS